MSCPELSIVIPALNEQDNVGPLVEQVRKTVVEAGTDAELIIVDDGSTDQTPARLAALMADHPWLVVLRRDTPMGQSAAMHAGIHAARGAFIATLDADLQNDPADLPAMLARLKDDGADFVQGDRSRDRQDNWVRKFGSKVGRAARRLVLGDPVRDTGCSARVVRAEIARQIPLQYKGVHRFMPVYGRMLGASVIEMPARHRPRTAGESKYGMGLLTRGPAGLFDLIAMKWMSKRLRDTRVRRVEGGAP